MFSFISLLPSIYGVVARSIQVRNILATRHDRLDAPNNDILWVKDCAPGSFAVDIRFWIGASYTDSKL